MHTCSSLVLNETNCNFLFLKQSSLIILIIPIWYVFTHIDITLCMLNVSNYRSNSWCLNSAHIGYTKSNSDLIVAIIYCVFNRGKYLRKTDCGKIVCVSCIFSWITIGFKHLICLIALNWKAKTLRIKK